MEAGRTFMSPSDPWTIASALFRPLAWAWTAIRSFKNAQKRRRALQLHFEATDHPPYCVERAEWTDDGRYAGTIRTYCVGVTNASDQPLTVSVVVEELGPNSVRPERALQAFDAPAGRAEAVVPPHNNAMTLFDVVEVIEGAEFAWFCYALPVNERSADRHTYVRLRATGGESIARLLLGIRTHAPDGRFVGLEARRLTRYSKKPKTRRVWT